MAIKTVMVLVPQYQEVFEAGTQIEAAAMIGRLRHKGYPVPPLATFIVLLDDKFWTVSLATAEKWIRKHSGPAGPAAFLAFKRWKGEVTKGPKR